jgi:hypothetical protein
LSINEYLLQQAGQLLSGIFHAARSKLPNKAIVLDLGAALGYLLAHSLKTEAEKTGHEIEFTEVLTRSALARIKGEEIAFYKTAASTPSGNPIVHIVDIPQSIDPDSYVAALNSRRTIDGKWDEAFEIERKLDNNEVEALQRGEALFTKPLSETEKYVVRLCTTMGIKNALAAVVSVGHAFLNSPPRDVDRFTITAVTKCTRCRQRPELLKPLEQHFGWPAGSSELYYIGGIGLVTVGGMLRFVFPWEHVEYPLRVIQKGVFVPAGKDEVTLADLKAIPQ